MVFLVAAFITRCQHTGGIRVIHSVAVLLHLCQLEWIRVGGGGRFVLVLQVGCKVYRRYWPEAVLRIGLQQRRNHAYYCPGDS